MTTPARNRTRWLLPAILLLSLLFTFSLYVLADGEKEETTLQISSFEALASALNNPEQPSRLVLSNNITHTYNLPETALITVSGVHTLDLNGYTLSVKSGTNADLTLFAFAEGAVLTVDDLSDTKSGTIVFTSEQAPLPSSAYRMVARDLFSVGNTSALTIKEGTVVAGGESRAWIGDGIESYNDTYYHFEGFATELTCGNVVTVKEGGTLTVKGGSLIAHGYARGNAEGAATPDAAAFACVKAEMNSTVTLFDGRFTARAGASGFALHDEATVAVHNGVFTTEKASYVRLSDLGAYPTVLSYVPSGKINLPLAALVNPDDTVLYRNDKILPFSSSTVLGNADGEVYRLITVSGGNATLSPSGIWDNAYRPGATGTVGLTYSRVYADSTLNYRWFLTDTNGNTVPLTEMTGATVAPKDITSVSLQEGGYYTLRCVVTESYAALNAPTSFATLSDSYSFAVLPSTSDIAAVALTTPLDVNGMLYADRTAPSFTVSGAPAYSVTSTTWYKQGTTTPLSASAKLETNGSYYARFVLTAKNGYRFSGETRVTLVAGGTSLTMFASPDGKNAFVVAQFRVGCAHKETAVVYNDVQHMSVCSVCGFEVNAHVHVLGPFTVTSEPSLTEKGEATRSCTGCDYKVTESLPMLPEEDSKRVIDTLLLTLDTPFVGAAVPTPSFANDYFGNKLTVSSAAWTDSAGASITKFAVGGLYTLTFTVSVNEDAELLFADEVALSVPYATETVVTTNEEKTTLSVTVTLNARSNITVPLYLPTVTAGSRIVNCPPVFTYVTSLRAVWYRDGKAIGSYKVVGQNATDPIDLDENDGISFATATFENNHIYLCRAFYDMQADVSGSAVDSFKFPYTNNALAITYLPGNSGMISASYLLTPVDTNIHQVNVFDITAPFVSGAPDTTARVPDSALYRVDSVAFNVDGDRFLCKKSYTVTVTVSPLYGCSFDTENLRGSVNGLEASLTRSGSKVILTYTFAPTEHHFRDGTETFTRPSCSQAGEVSVTCRHCDTKTAFTLPAYSHTLVKIEALAPTCQKEGRKAHYLCSHCYSRFEDEEATKPLTTDEVLLPASAEAHSLEAKTLHANTTSHFRTCTECGLVRQDAEAHSYAEGSLACIACGHVKEENKPLPPVTVIGGSNTPTEPEEPSTDKEPARPSSQLILIVIVCCIVIFAILLTLVLLLILRLRNKDDDEEYDDEAEAAPSSTEMNDGATSESTDAPASTDGE